MSSRDKLSSSVSVSEEDPIDADWSIEARLLCVVCALRVCGTAYDC